MDNDGFTFCEFIAWLFSQQDITTEIATPQKKNPITENKIPPPLPKKKPTTEKKKKKTPPDKKKIVPPPLQKKKKSSYVKI
jgi:hypothetical protein